MTWGLCEISLFRKTLETLKRFNVYSCKHVFLNGQLVAKSQQHCPIFGYYGKKYQGIELWRCYFPKRTSFRFITNWPSKKIQGYDQLPKSGKLLVITKSLKDVMCLYSCGITACAPNSENLFISDAVLFSELVQRRVPSVLSIANLAHQKAHLLFLLFLEIRSLDTADGLVKG